MIKSIITAVAVAATSLVAVPEAQAAVDCVRGDGFTVCYEHVSSNGRYNRWNVQLTNSYTTENFVITCYGKQLDTFKSRGGASQAEAQKIAEDFCAVW